MMTIFPEREAWDETGVMQSDLAHVLLLLAANQHTHRTNRSISLYTLCYFGYQLCHLREPFFLIFICTALLTPHLVLSFIFVHYLPV